MQPNPAPLTAAETELKSEIPTKGQPLALPSVSEQAQPSSVRAAALGAVTPESRGTAGSASFQSRDTAWPLWDTEQQPWNSLKGWTNMPGLTQTLERITHPGCSQRNKPTTEESGAF